jgi:NAD(P)H-hydrate repair Nnr-like enzyme with NAD(P)H-hydrate dehydratase domain
MRQVKQLHDNEGRFTPKEDNPPKDYSNVTATILTPHEKELLRIVSIMETTDEERVLNYQFAQAIKTISSLHGERLQIIGPEREDDTEDRYNAAIEEGKLDEEV